jgi:hypothetical protein
VGKAILWPRAGLFAAVLAAVSMTAPLSPARASTPSELSQTAASLADTISLDWSHTLNQAGSIVDPVTGQAQDGSGQTQVGYGQTLLAYGMLRATVRTPALELIPTVVQALLSSGHVAQAPFKLLGLAESLLSAAGALGATPTASLQQATLEYPPFGTMAPNAPCFRRVGCYGNLKLVNATAILAALAALPGLAGPAGAALASPQTAVREVRRLLAVTIPKLEIADGLLDVGGARLTGAVLSDPTRNPTAYLALSAMMLGRSLELIGTPPPPPAVRSFQRAVTALLGLTAPDGELSYMGRGQGQVWTMASAAAACALAMRLLPAQTAITTRCEGMVDTELAALGRRRSLGGVGIAIVPRTTWARGVDPYVNRADYNGLCVYALNVAVDALQGLPDPGEQPPPGTVNGVHFADTHGSGVASTSLNGVWFAVHRLSNTARDSRWGFGLMAMQRLVAGAWSSVLTDRPLGPGEQGPVLILHGHPYRPTGLTMQAAPGRVVIHGGWHLGKRLIRSTTFTYRAVGQGVTLSVPVKRGDVLMLREWVLPGQPGIVAIHAPTGRETATRSSLLLGNDSSDSLDQVSYEVKAPKAGLLQVAWR